MTPNIKLNLVHMIYGSIKESQNSKPDSYDE